MSKTSGNNSARTNPAHPRADTPLIQTKRRPRTAPPRGLAASGGSPHAVSSPPAGTSYVLTAWTQPLVGDGAHQPCSEWPNSPSEEQGQEGGELSTAIARPQGG